jgi:hypothetical protein
MTPNLYTPSVSAWQRNAGGASGEGFVLRCSGETLALRVSDVDFDRRLIRVRQISRQCHAEDCRREVQSIECRYADV